jgi:NADH-quinone oxidoreductase subunit M
MEIPILTVLLFLPFAFALGVWFFSGNDEAKTRMIAFTGTLCTLIIALGVFWKFNTQDAGIQFEENAPWIRAINVHYHLGIDGLSIAMVLLTALITCLVILASWSRGGAGLKNYFGLILLEEFGLLGAFTALDFFHWFIFWEFSLIPMFFLIKLFGHESRNQAAFKFFIYTLVGSVFLVLGFQYIYICTGTWDFLELKALAANGVLNEKLMAKWSAIQMGADNVPWFLRWVVFVSQSIGSMFWWLLTPVRWLWGVSGGALLTWMGFTFPEMSVPIVIALFVMAGFAVKIPIWPFHTWLPSAYTQAPTAGSIILTALMSKMGVYGFLRIVLPLFHEEVQSMLLPLTWLALASILFGALAAFAQRDLKTLVAYSSLSHLGYCSLGVFMVVAGSQFAEDRVFALNGVIFQMVAHGLSAAGLFYFVGLLERRCESLHFSASGDGFRAIDARAIDTYGGIRKAVPVFSGLMGITIFASLGLPGLCGFVGEFMIFKGSFSGTVLLWHYLALAALGLLLTAVYLLTMAQKVFFGPQDPKWNALPDLQGRELWTVSAPLVALMFIIGVYPALVIDLSNATVLEFAKIFG